MRHKEKSSPCLVKTGAKHAHHGRSSRSAKGWRSSLQLIVAGVLLALVVTLIFNQLNQVRTVAELTFAPSPRTRAAHVTHAASRRSTSPQPEVHATENSNPFSTLWDNSILGCAIASQEALADVREWLQYHRTLGVDHIVLFDNSGDGGAQAAGVRDFIEDGFLTFLVLDGVGKQVGAYQHCAATYAKAYSWLLMLDLDEFIVIHDGYAKQQAAPLKEVMRYFRFYPGLWLQWRVFGPGDHEHRPPEGGPLKHYTKCVQGFGPINMYGKSLVNMFWLRQVSNAHAGFFRGDGMHVTDALEPMPPVLDENTQNYLRASSRMPVWLDHPRAHSRSYRAVVHHYLTRSRDDYARKMQRGTADKATGHTIRTMEVLEKIVKHEKRAPECEAAVAPAMQCCYRDGKPWPPVPERTSGAQPQVRELPTNSIPSAVRQSDYRTIQARPLRIHPFSEAWQSDVVVCAAMPPHLTPAQLLHWVDHHKSLGVQKVALVDVRTAPASAEEAEATKQLLDVVPKATLDFFGDVLVSADATPEARAAAANQRCIDAFRAAASWIAFVQLTDFLVLRGGLRKAASLPDMLHEPRFRFSPGVVAPVFQFFASAQPAESSASASDAWTGSCKFSGNTDFRAIGNTFWVNTTSGLSSFHYRGDLLPITDAGRQHLPSAQAWPLGVKHPLPWHNITAWIRAKDSPAFGSRLAVFSFLPASDAPSNAPPPSEKASALCQDILRLADIQLREKSVAAPPR